MPTLEAIATYVPVMELESVVAENAVALPIATFDDLLERHQHDLYRFALYLTRHRPDADDLYQETLLKAFRAFRRLDGTANHRAWLFTIASNTFLAGCRTRGRLIALDEQTRRTVPAPEGDQAACLDARTLLREVAAAVARLPAKQRLALILRKYQGLSYGEIAATLPCSEAAARANVHEALRKLRDRFADRL